MEIRKFDVGRGYRMHVLPQESGYYFVRLYCPADDYFCATLKASPAATAAFEIPNPSKSALRAVANSLLKTGSHFSASHELLRK